MPWRQQRLKRLSWHRTTQAATQTQTYTQTLSFTNTHAHVCLLGWIAGYNETANEIQKWIAEKRRLFSSKPAVTTVAEMESVYNDFGNYRMYEKPMKQKQLFDNKDLFAKLRTSQRHYGMGGVVCVVDKTPGGLAVHWSIVRINVY